jgi:hypothetical protein
MNYPNKIQSHPSRRPISLFWCSRAKLQYPVAASSVQENVVAMGLRATLAQSDISTKLAIAAKTTAW